MDWALRIGNFNIGILDLVVIAIVLFTSLGCTFAGFSRSAAKSLGWVLCYPIALYLTSILANIIHDNTNIVLFLSTMFAFAVISVVIFALFNILGSFLGRILSGVGLSAIDSLLGFVWGVLVSLFLSFLVIYIISGQPVFNVQPLIDKSFMYDLLSPLFPSTKNMIMGAWNALV